MRSRIWILLATVLVVVIVVAFLPPIPQSQAYHDLADNRLLLSVPNCLNVISNVLFLFVGLWGLRFVWATNKGTQFIDIRERWPWLAFFAGVALTSIGSAYYHLHPNDKVFEVADRPIFAYGGIVSGHTLKHVAAALSAWWISRMLRFRAVIRPTRARSSSAVPLDR